MDLRQFEGLPVMGILRDIRERDLKPVIDTVIDSGLRTIEITMNTGAACKLIDDAVKISAGKLDVGAGTVTDMDSLRSALGAGADFIVMPVFNKEITQYCLKRNIPVFPGALTPQEIFLAWESGASMVKVFPAKMFGPGYFKEIKGPFKDIKLMACSGVTPDNLGDYFANGASAVAFGSSVFKSEWLDNKDYGKIGAAVKSYIDKFNQARSRFS